jgi:hypothetical protein
MLRCLAAKAVQGATLALKSVNNIHGGNSFPARMLCVGYRIADHVLEENLQHRSRLLIDEAGNTLHTATTSKAADGRLRDALDVVAQNLPVTLGAALAKPLASFPSSRHLFDYFGRFLDGFICV